MPVFVCRLFFSLFVSQYLLLGHIRMKSFVVVVVFSATVLYILGENRNDPASHYKSALDKLKEVILSSSFPHFPTPNAVYSPVSFSPFWISTMPLLRFPLSMEISPVSFVVVLIVVWFVLARRKVFCDNGKFCMECFVREWFINSTETFKQLND